jgi:hypothetical protein
MTGLMIWRISCTAKIDYPCKKQQTLIFPLLLIEYNCDHLRARQLDDGNDDIKNLFHNEDEILLLITDEVDLVDPGFIDFRLEDFQTESV